MRKKTKEWLGLLALLGAKVILEHAIGAANQQKEQIEEKKREELRKGSIDVEYRVKEDK